MLDDFSQKKVIGQVEAIDLPEQSIFDVPARIDTGARTSALWASNIRKTDNGLVFKLFDVESKFYTGKDIICNEFEMRQVTPSNGVAEDRYMIKMLVIISGKKIRARFTLANRSTQKYPVLVGRNILRGKFVVDVKHKHIGRA
jgi:hypothetical protein